MMTTRSRCMILAGAAFATAGIAGCTTGTPSVATPPSNAQYTVRPAAADLAYKYCPLEEAQLGQICQILEAELGEVDYFLPDTIDPQGQFYACGCNVETADAANALVGTPYRGAVDVISSVHLEGSNCNEICSVTVGGSGGAYKWCVAMCKAQ